MPFSKGKYISDLFSDKLARKLMMKMKTKHSLNYNWKCPCSSSGSILFYIRCQVRCPSCCSIFNNMQFLKRVICACNETSLLRLKLNLESSTNVFQSGCFTYKSTSVLFKTMASNHSSGWNPQCSFTYPTHCFKHCHL